MIHLSKVSESISIPETHTHTTIDLHISSRERLYEGNWFFTKEGLEVHEGGKVLVPRDQGVNECAGAPVGVHHAVTMEPACCLSLQMPRLPLLLHMAGSCLWHLSGLSASPWKSPAGCQLLAAPGQGLSCFHPLQHKGGQERIRLKHPKGPIPLKQGSCRGTGNQILLSGLHGSFRNSSVARPPGSIFAS